eukprot:4675219-Prymnesium_polylepis.1
MTRPCLRRRSHHPRGSCTSPRSTQAGAMASREEVLLAASWVARVVFPEMRGEEDGAAASGAVAEAEETEEVRVGAARAVTVHRLCCSCVRLTSCHHTRTNLSRSNRGRRNRRHQKPMSCHRSQCYIASSCCPSNKS